jgi:hypothetical protein
MDENEERNIEKGSLQRPDIAKRIDRSRIFVGSMGRADWRYKLQTIFPHYIDGTYRVDIERIIHDSEGLTYATPFIHICKLVKYLRYYMRSVLPVNYTQLYNHTVVDATAGIGGDTLGFALTNNGFSRVFSIELDAVRHHCLAENVKLYHLTNRVTTVHADFIEWYRTMYRKVARGAIIHIDAPWGGKNYKTMQVIHDLYFIDKHGRDVSLNQQCKDILREGDCPAIVLKLPTNYDRDAFVSYGLKTEFIEITRKILHVILTM